MPPSSTDRVRLTSDDVTVACAVLTLPEHDLLERPEARARLEALRDAGVLDAQGELVEPTATIARVLARAEVKLELRVWCARTEVVEHRAWADEHDAVIARISATGLDLKLIAWEHLPLATALLLGLLASAVPVDEQRDRLDVAPAALLAARSTMLAGDRASARAALGAQTADRAAADSAMALVEGLRVVWSVSSAWREPGGAAHGGSLSALDAGPSGWWLLEPGADLARLRPTGPQALWTALHGLLPSEVHQG